MPRYRSLHEDQRDKPRTIADVIDVLLLNGAFDGAQVGKIRVGGLRLPSQQIVGLVGAFVESAADETIALHTSQFFRAQRQISAGFEIFDIFKLDGATFDGSGAVQLSDGTRLRAVELTPSLLPYHVTELEWCIIRHTIAFMGVESECRYLLPSERFCYALDCSALPALQDRVPLLKQIRGYILDQDPALEDLSEQKIADAMCKFGIRIPRTRRTRRLGSTAAT